MKTSCKINMKTINMLNARRRSPEKRSQFFTKANNFYNAGERWSAPFAFARSSSDRFGSARLRSVRWNNVRSACMRFGSCGVFSISFSPSKVLAVGAKCRRHGPASQREREKKGRKTTVAKINVLKSCSDV